MADGAIIYKHACALGLRGHRVENGWGHPTAVAGRTAASRARRSHARSRRSGTSVVWSQSGTMAPPLALLSAGDRTTLARASPRPASRLTCPDRFRLPPEAGRDLRAGGYYRQARAQAAQSMRLIRRTQRRLSPGIMINLQNYARKFREHIVPVILITMIQPLWARSVRARRRSR